MAKTDLKLYSKDASEKKITTSLTYINPSATSSTLKQFAVKLNNLTTNSYSETDRVQTINVDTEQVPIPYEEIQDIESYSLTALSFNPNSLTGGHAVAVAQIEQTAVLIRALTLIEMYTKNESIPNTTLGVSYDGDSGKVYLVSTSDFNLINTTVVLTAKYVNLGSNGTPLYKIRTSKLEIPITVS